MLQPDGPSGRASAFGPVRIGEGSFSLGELTALWGGGATGTEGPAGEGALLSGDCSKCIIPIDAPPMIATQTAMKARAARKTTSLANGFPMRGPRCFSSISAISPGLVMSAAIPVS